MQSGGGGWLWPSGRESDDRVPGGVLNGAKVGTDCRKIAPEFTGMFHSVLAHFLHNGVIHDSLSRSSSGEHISGQVYPSFSTICRTIIRVNGFDR
jgi:hypothetical protein